MKLGQGSADRLIRKFDSTFNDHFDNFRIRKKIYASIASLSAWDTVFLAMNNAGSMFQIIYTTSAWKSWNFLLPDTDGWRVIYANIIIIIITKYDARQLDISPINSNHINTFHLWLDRCPTVHRIRSKLSTYKPHSSEWTLWVSIPFH